ncbi:hypothetical protein K443DRAFT_126301 [Laccaria amethystina LaAM-08-1]|uniref:Uncharacterized protein n=1 Tax=Laccaria amethystina LaAM-08-1 TaxID=1095629 RepID=A0A0C9WSU6_9AGAR|nr:hypothetical protein K443DRAFT_126301 [Laccaria amethystina LaAM-08-1]
MDSREKKQRKQKAALPTQLNARSIGCSQATRARVNICQDQSHGDSALSKGKSNTEGQEGGKQLRGRGFSWLNGVQGLVTPLDVVRQRFSPELSKGETEQKLSFRQCRTVFCLQTEDEPLRKIFPVLCEVVVNLKKDSVPRFHLHTVHDPSSATSSLKLPLKVEFSLPKCLLLLRHPNPPHGVEQIKFE